MVDVYPREECNFEPLERLPADAPAMCLRRENRMACRGDSGGPAVFATMPADANLTHHRRRFHLAGAASFGRPGWRGGTSVYASLNSEAVLDWIRDVAGGECKWWR